MAIRTEDHSDQSKFGNRLWKVIEKKHYNSPKELATVLYNSGLVQVNSKPGKYCAEKDVQKNAIASVEKKIVRHLHSDTASDLQGEFLIAYCKHLGCSADYLLGFTDVISGDIEIRRICEKTGLSEEAVERFVSSMDFDTEGYLHRCWSTLIESELFMQLPMDFSNLYEQCCDTLHFRACISAAQKALSLTPAESFGYNMEAAKISTYEKGEREHYSAYYGMMHKIAQDVANKMDKLAETYSHEQCVYENEYERALYEAQTLIAGFNNETPPPMPKSLQNKKNDDEDGFKFNKHYIL